MLKIIKTVVSTGLIVTLSAGCWGQYEVNDLALVTAFGIDLAEDNKVLVSVQIIVPHSSGGEGATESSGGNFETIVRTARGVSVADAIANIEKKIPRKLFWGQSEVLYIGEAFARKGIRSEIDFFLREPKTRLNIIPFVVGGDAKKILDTSPALSHYTAEATQNELNLMIQEPETMNNILEPLNSDISDIALPFIHPNPEGGTETSVIRQAVFKEDRLAEILDPHESQGLNIIRNQLEPTIITVQVDGTEEFITLRLLESETTHRPEVTDDTWHMTLDVEMRDDIIQNGTDLHLEDPRQMTKVQQAVQRDIKNQVEQTVQKAQKNQTDILGFGEAFYREYPAEIKTIHQDWEDRFPAVQVTVNVKINIERPGFNTHPTNTMKEG